jgi:hypothetical protein
LDSTAVTGGEEDSNGEKQQRRLTIEQRPYRKRQNARGANQQYRHHRPLHVLAVDRVKRKSADSRLNVFADQHKTPMR